MCPIQCHHLFHLAYLSHTILQISNLSFCGKAFPPAFPLYLLSSIPENMFLQYFTTVGCKNSFPQLPKTSWQLKQLSTGFDWSIALQQQLHGLLYLQSWSDAWNKNSSKATHIFCDALKTQQNEGGNNQARTQWFQATFKEYLDLVPVLCTIANFTCNDYEKHCELGRNVNFLLSLWNTIFHLA